MSISELVSIDIGVNQLIVLFNNFFVKTNKRFYIELNKTSFE